MPELADDQDVKGNVERARDLGCDGDAATAKAEHDDVTSVREVAEFGGEQLACFGTVAKTLLGDQRSRPRSDRIHVLHARFHRCGPPATVTALAVSIAHHDALEQCRTSHSPASQDLRLCVHPRARGSNVIQGSIAVAGMKVHGAHRVERNYRGEALAACC